MFKNIPTLLTFMGLRTYIARRLLLAIPVLLGCVILIFAVVQFLPPGLRAAMYVTDKHKPEMIQRAIAEHGLDQPVYVQFYIWLRDLIVKQDLGYDNQGVPVLTALLIRMPATVEIVMFASPIIIFVGIYFGVLAGANRNKLIDHASRLVAIMGTSLPSFWFGIVLLSIFYAGLGWFPPGRVGQDAISFMSNPANHWVPYTGFITIDSLLNGQSWIFVDAIRHLVLPVTVLTLINSATMIRVTRSSMLEALGKDYITAARAKGLSRKEVINKHARRNALIPAITLSGLLVAGLMTGVTITETVFDFPGIGRYAAQSAQILDIAPVIGYTLLTAIVFIISNLIVDVLYAYIDPRIRLG
jgi:peptide/nickel transport system permease protein